jgi:hypothetical protein
MSALHGRKEHRSRAGEELLFDHKVCSACI